MTVPVSPKRTALLALASERILVLDGAMGTMIQSLQYDEAAFRGERFKDFHRDLRGNNDLLILTQPKAIEHIHADYLRAGADIVATNTFSSTSIAQADYDLSGIAYEMNLEGARLARAAAECVSAEDRKPRFVAGAIGPTNRTASISPDVSSPDSAALPSTICAPPMAIRSRDCWTAAPTCCWSRPSSTPSTPRPRSTPSRRSARRAASTCP
jgi:5-methyltetrahydrofolate--homocysteine methyltransferase